MRTRKWSSEIHDNKEPAMHHGRMFSRLALALAASLVTFSHAANPFFPGAEGFGAAPTGTVPAAGWLSTASVYRVTTTADTINPSTGKPAIGTLRGAFWDYTNPSSPKQQASNRIVVFDVGGVFQLTQGSLDIKTVNNLYVAGQTAPSPVIVYGNSTQITKSSNTMTSNLVMRHMTFRKGAGDGEDAIGFTGGSGTGTVATNMILDHISASWAEDENFSVANNNTNVTVQYSLIADALTSNHAYGSLIRPQVNSSVTFHHNLYANNASRQARFGTYNASTLTADFRNNVIYNWRDRASYTGGSSEAEQEFTDINYIGNYLIAGSGTVGSANTAFSVDKNVTTRVYQSGNYVDSDKALNPGGIPNGTDRGWSAFVVSSPVTDQTMTQMPTAFAAASVSTQLAPDAYRQVIDHVGNSPWARDAIDARIINNVKTNTGPLNGIGAAGPNAGELAAMLATPTISRPAGFDTDGDGMPDAWELQRGLNPNLASDGKLDHDNDQYTNVEEYINDLGAFPAPHPIAFTGASSNRFAHSSNFDANPDPAAVTRWQPSRFDTVTIGATAVVDAIAQDAGSIVIAADAGSTGSLAIHSGSLFVRQNILIGGATSAAGELHLSGGKLITAGTIGVGTAPSGVFGFTGGTLVAANIDATNLRSSVAQSSIGTFGMDGATAVLAPGDVGVAGRLNVTGGLALTAGNLSIDLGGTAAATGFQTTDPAHDAVVVSGAATLGGNLMLTSVSGYVPEPLIAHTILTAANVEGHFAAIGGNQISATRWLAVTYDEASVKVTATLPGDANVDGTVNFDDLLTLAQGYGASDSTWAAGDFTGNGTADFDDLLALAQQYGSTLLANGAIVTDAAIAARFEADWSFARGLVPEPGTLLGFVVVAGIARRR